MSIPKEPRQQMINLMYLVLTALLALNVSAEILNAFRLVNDGISNTNVALDSKNASIYTAFEDQMGMDAAKTKPHYDKALEARKISEEFYTYVQSLKDEVIAQSGGYNPDGTLSDEKNLDVTTRIMIDKKKGYELEQKINETRDRFLALLPENSRQTLGSQLTLSASWDQQKSQKRSWATYNFEMVPVIAAVTIMTKYQSDAKSTESMIIEHLISQIGKTDYKFDQLQAKIIAPSSYIMQGQQYKADIFVSATSSTQDITVLIGEFDKSVIPNESSLPVSTEQNPLARVTDSLRVDGGMGKFEKVGSGVGEQTYKGAVKVRKPDGTGFDYFPFKGNYQVATGGVVVSPDNLNVIYAGIPNPLSISVAGFSTADVSASIGGGGSSLSNKGNGKYDATASTPGQKATVNVSVKMPDGTNKTVGSAEFRIKRIPDPFAAINGTITEGGIKTGTLRAVRGIGAVMKDFDFEGVKYNITAFEVIYIPRRQDPQIIQNQGWQFNQNVAQVLQAAKPGDQITFRQIRAKGPDGTVRSLNAIALSVE